MTGFIPHPFQHGHGEFLVGETVLGCTGVHVFCSNQMKVNLLQNLLLKKEKSGLQTIYRERLQKISIIHKGKLQVYREST